MRFFLPNADKSVAVKSNLLDFGKYVQEMLPKYVQQTQVTYG